MSEHQYGGDGVCTWCTHDSLSSGGDHCKTRSEYEKKRKAKPVKWRDGVGVLWIDKIRSEFRATKDVGEKFLLLHELTQRTWGTSTLRRRTSDGDRMGVKDQRTARAMRLLAYLTKEAK